MSKASKTDWERLEKLKDEQIDTSDMPELADEFFARAELHVPPKQAVHDAAGCGRLELIQRTRPGLPEKCS